MQATKTLTTLNFTMNCPDLLNISIKIQAYNMQSQ